MSSKVSHVGKDVFMKLKYTRAHPGHWHSLSRWDVGDR